MIELYEEVLAQTVANYPTLEVFHPLAGQSPIQPWKDTDELYAVVAEKGRRDDGSMIQGVWFKPGEFYSFDQFRLDVVEACDKLMERTKDDGTESNES